MPKQNSFTVYTYTKDKYFQGGIKSIPDTVFSIAIDGRVSSTKIESANGRLVKHDGPHDLSPEEAVNLLDSISNMDMGQKKRSVVTDILEQATIAARQRVAGR